MRPRLALLIALGAAALLAAAALAVWIGGVWRMGWFAGPPRIAQGMWPVTGTPSPTWSQRLRQRFPIGASERELIEELGREGFKIDGPARRAGYGWASYPCVFTLTVLWRADDQGRIRNIQGGLLNACTQPDKLTPERLPRLEPAEPEHPTRTLVPAAQSA